MGIANIFLLLIQILLLVLLFRNPIINPPLDSHGMPKPINPLTGAVMPLDNHGQPILPPELRTIPKAGSVSKADKDSNSHKASVVTRENGPPEWESEISDASSDEEEKTLLEKQRSKELGAPHRRTSSQTQLRGYVVV